MIFLKDKHDMLGEEVVRSQTELDAVEAELAAETAELEKEVAAAAGGGGGGDAAAAAAATSE